MANPYNLTDEELGQIQASTGQRDLSRTQFNIMLPSGRVIPAGINPGEAATIQVGAPDYAKMGEDYLKSIGAKFVTNQGAGPTNAWIMPDGTRRDVVKDFYADVGKEQAIKQGQKIIPSGVLDRGTAQGASIASGFSGMNVVDPAKELAEARKGIVTNDISAGIADVTTKAQALQKKIQEIADYSESLSPEQQKEFGDVFSGRVTTGKYFSKAPDGSVTDLSKGQPIAFTAPVGGGLATNANGTPVFTPEQQKTIQSNLTTDTTQLDAILAGSGLDDASQAVLREYFKMTASGDVKKQAALVKILDSSISGADIVMKEQIKLLQNQLTSDLIYGKLNFDQKAELQRTQLADLRTYVTQQKDFLSLEETADMTALDRKLAADLEDSRQSAAEAGFTFSTRLAEKEKLLGTETGELRQSATRKFGLQKTELGQKLSIAERDVPTEIKRLQDEAAKQQADILRQHEGKLGSANLGVLPALLPGVSPTTGITGALETEREKGIISALGTGSALLNKF